MGELDKVARFHIADRREIINGLERLITLFVALFACSGLYPLLGGFDDEINDDVFSRFEF